MDETDFDAMLVGASAPEAKRLWKVLSDWCKGDENSFPVHLALLTRAQWRAAARIPSLVNNSTKLLELRLAESRQETNKLVKDFAQTVEAKVTTLESAFAKQNAALQQTIAKMQTRFDEAEKVARSIEGELASGAVSWKEAKYDFIAEREKLEKRRKEIEKQLNRRELLQVICILLFCVFVGIIIGAKVLR